MQSNSYKIRTVGGTKVITMPNGTSGYYSRRVTADGSIVFVKEKDQEVVKN